MEKIQYVGLKDFKGFEKNIVKEISLKHLNKISRDIGNFLLIITLKKHSISNKKLDESVKYSAKAKIECPAILINSSYADWDLRRTVHITLERLHSEILHKLKINKKSWVRKRFRNA